jgi:hypothetical protein
VGLIRKDKYRFIARRKGLVFSDSLHRKDRAFRNQNIFKIFSTLFVVTDSHLVTSNYELLLVTTLSETRSITRILSESVLYFYVPHRLTSNKRDSLPSAVCCAQVSGYEPPLTKERKEKSNLFFTSRGCSLRRVPHHPLVYLSGPSAVLIRLIMSRGCTGHRLWVAIVRKWE